MSYVAVGTASQKYAVGGFLDTLLSPLVSTATQTAQAVVPTDAEQLLIRLVEDIEFRTAFIPPQKFKTRELLAPGPPSTTTRLVKPTIILSGGTLGRKVIASGGEAGPEDWKAPAMLTGAAVVVGLYLLYESSFQMGKYRGRQSAAKK